MTKTLALRMTAVLGFLAVGLGAFGAHGLKPLLAQNGTAATWETAVLYHFIHLLVMLWLVDRPAFATGAWLSFFVGILIFSGSLYLLAVTNIKWLGAITPLGGVSFLVGWLWVALKADVGSSHQSVHYPLS